jgi:hypothetical protein
MSGSASRLVINHADAELYIQPPMFDTSVAIQTIVKVGWRNGLHGERVGCVATFFAMAQIYGPFTGEPEMAVRMPLKIWRGLGGQPGTATSTGITLDTRPQLA